MKNVTTEVQIKSAGMIQEKKKTFHLWRSRKIQSLLQAFYAKRRLLRLLPLLFPYYPLSAGISLFSHCSKPSCDELDQTAHVLLWRAYLFLLQSRIPAEALNWKQGCESHNFSSVTYSSSAFSLLLLTWSPSPEATLTWLQSWTATVLEYQSLLPEKSLVLACAHSQCTYYLSSRGMGNCCFRCSINCPLVKESRTFSCARMVRKEKIFSSPESVKKLSWTVTGNCHLGEPDTCVCFSP